jgi:hypothetical protein
MDARDTRHLSTFEKDELLRFFLHHMRSEQRVMLMAKYPVHYAILYPSVTVGVLNIRTQEAIESLPANDYVYGSGPHI